MAAGASITALAAWHRGLQDHLACSSKKEKGYLYDDTDSILYRGALPNSLQDSASSVWQRMENNQEFLTQAKQALRTTTEPPSGTSLAGAEEEGIPDLESFRLREGGKETTNGKTRTTFKKDRTQEID
jgi:hypothetical protein